MRKLAITMALASTALATPAVARDKSVYVGIEGGVMILTDTNLDFSDPSDDTFLRNAITLNHKTGFDVAALIGYDFGLVRVEGELGYKRAGLSDVTILNTFVPLSSSTFTQDSNGSTRAISAMVNALLDFGDENGWSGYAGGGVGVASVRQRVSVDFTPVGTASATLVNSYDSSISDKDTSFAYQVLAGIRHPITYNIDLGLKYRFFSTRKNDFDTGDGTNLSGRFRSHSLLATLTYNFAAPPPPPPPPPVEAPPAPPPPATQTCPDGSVILATEVCRAPAPVAVGPFFVFFDWDKSDITPEAAAILDNAAAAYQQTGSAQVMLAGHADRSGSDQYNVGLSQRRADAVRAYLAGRGVADGAMTTSAFGESKPLVQTEDGVREPQNRRVEITFGPGSGQ